MGYRSKWAANFVTAFAYHTYIFDAISLDSFQPILGLLMFFDVDQCSHRHLTQHFQIKKKGIEKRRRLTIGAINNKVS